MLIKGIIVSLLLFLFYQDMRYRAIYWVCFPLLLVLIIILQHTDINTLLLQGGINTGFLLLQLFILSLYFSLKQRRLVNITRQHLGWGDVLFLMMIAFYFSPLNYLVFYISSLLMVLIVILLIRLRTSELKIPLAGMQAFIFSAFLLTDWSSAYIDLASDTWILNMLNL